ncbi:MAG: pirin family protein [Myxococcales bacterium]|nr:pirin family protein [Myxococcales bacterium]
MSEGPADPVISVHPLGFPWITFDPFLFCVHHDDAYPPGNEHLGPRASLAGRALGNDFEGKDGWRMYHGQTVPGFPSHPHRGFETVTVARRGHIDHSDSLGAAARFGQGDVQWMTAGRGVVHSEMFPLLDSEGPNPAELFQIWLNLPAADKMAPPHFSMLWSSQLPRVVSKDEAGGTAEVTVIAGRLGDAAPPPPPPRSWAAQPRAEVAIWSIKLGAGARLRLPAASPGLGRTLYVFLGQGVTIGERRVDNGRAVRLRSDAAVELRGGDAPAELLLLQGRPIGEEVAQYGPFVMNTRAELVTAFDDYQRTQFGGWPWPSDAPVHPRDAGRFARHADGRLERVERGDTPTADD